MSEVGFYGEPPTPLERAARNWERQRLDFVRRHRDEQRLRLRWKGSAITAWTIVVCLTVDILVRWGLGWCS